MTKVLFISGSFPPIKCGVGDYLYHLARSIGQYSDIQVAVLTSKSVNPVTKDDRVQLFPIINNWGVSCIPRIFRVIRKWNPDIVHIQYPTAGYWFSPGLFRMLTLSLIPAISFFSGCRVIQTWHEYEIHRTNTILYFLLRALVPSDIIVVRPDFLVHCSPFVNRILCYKNIINIRGAPAILRIDYEKNQLQEFKKQKLGKQKRLIVFFGFIYPHKGVELLLEIADSNTDQIVIAGGYQDESDYIKQFKARIATNPWRGKVNLLGFVSHEEASMLLSVADAVVLPFRGQGGGEWSSSLQAALSHHCFVITTSTKHHGYNREENTYYAKVDNIEDMKYALNKKLDNSKNLNIQTIPVAGSEWKRVADSHISLYTQKNRGKLIK